MKKLVPLALSLLLAHLVSCRNVQRDDPEDRKSEAIEETREKGMEKHREWAGSSKAERDSAAHKRDSILSDSTRPLGADSLKRDQKK